MLTPSEFYKTEAVRKRVSEYCGGIYGKPETFTAEYLVGYGEYLYHRNDLPFVAVGPDDINWLFESGLDIFRSVWDKKSILSVLDIEYFNKDFPGKIYINPQNTFEKLEPIYREIKRIYNKYNIPHICIMTGQGYHFTSMANHKEKINKELEKEGYIPDTLVGKYMTNRGKRHRKVSILHGKCFDGMGRMMEFLCHLIIKDLDKNDIPIVISDISVGTGKQGREGISLDLTMYSDPIYMRDIRTPFSTHQKHKVMRYKVGEKIANEIPVQISIPRSGTGINEMPLKTCLKMRRHFEHSAEYASKISCVIPDGSSGMLKLLKDYRKSDLKKFHKYFDAGNEDNWRDWPQTYDLFSGQGLPYCLEYIIKNPNPYMLQPTHIQNLVRLLIHKAWHPKDIAGLMRSKYERDYSWSEDWFKYDATNRAEWWVRVYAGLIYTGLDNKIDMNCISHQEKEACFKPFCGYNLADFNKILKKPY